MQYVDARSAGPKKVAGQVRLYGQEDLRRLHVVGTTIADCMAYAEGLCVPGVTTLAIEDAIRAKAAEQGCIPSAQFYRGRRNYLETSINHVVLGGIPDDRPLRDGDIITLGISLFRDGMHATSMRTYRVGEVLPKAEAVIKAAFEGLQNGWRAASPTGTTGDIGAAIEATAQHYRMSPIQDFVGSGKGLLLNDNPNVPCFGQAGTGVPLRPGMVFSIMAAFALGRPHVKILSDGWSAVTRDRTLAATFMETVVMTARGAIPVTAALLSQQAFEGHLAGLPA